MCGIAGLLYFQAERRVDRSLIDRMTDVLSHRGPDGRGVHVDGPLGLGHRRLAIIDLSDDAAQPMSNEDGTVWVVLNGEIYNFRELRADLEAQGHRFRSKSDTEVLVHLYEERGPELVHALRGMFAFAIWDANLRRLLLARDRFGQKPLVYRLTGESLRFGSEIKAIHADPDVPREPDPSALNAFLSVAYVPGPHTAFRGVTKLPPGHLMTVEADGRSSLRRYWRLALTPKRRVARFTRGALRRCAEELLALLDEATRLRLVSDVPLGAFLSGGVDSSAVVASMLAAGAGSPKTFAIGFSEPAYDESDHARRVAEHLGTDHTELTLGPDAFADLERVAWHYGEPFADASALPTFAVSQLARKHVTVALTGDGSDELLCGNNRHQALRLEERLRGARLLAARARSRLVAGVIAKSGQARLAGELMRGRAARGKSLDEFYLDSLRYLWPNTKQELYTDGFYEATRSPFDAMSIRDALAASDGESFTERAAHADAVTYLPDDILVKVDVASMAHGLECRAPFLDHVLAEFVARLPFRLKMRRLRTKCVLKDALASRLPKETLARKKQGFGVPLEHWFRAGLRDTLAELLLSKRARERGLFRPEVVQRYVTEHAAGVVDRRNVLFPLVMLETWYRVCMEGDYTP